MLLLFNRHGAAGGHHFVTPPTRRHRGGIFFLDAEHGTGCPQPLGAVPEMLYCNIEWSDRSSTPRSRRRPA
jgi:hypothetical protein